MNVAEFLSATAPDPKKDYPECMSWIRPRALCADGFTVSIQANNFSYCTPRRWDAKTYADVELGFPLIPDPIIEEWAEDPEDPMNTIYAFVPIPLVDKMVAAHGGIIGYIDINTHETTLLKTDCGPYGCIVVAEKSDS